MDIWLLPTKQQTTKQVHSLLQRVSTLVVEAAVLHLHVCETSVVIGVDVGHVHLGYGDRK